VTTLTRRDRAVRLVRYYHCRACALYYPRKLRYCPDCHTRKFDHGYGIQKMNRAL
jgi:hypothetical protein